jgi:hypothetical protein
LPDSDGWYIAAALPLALLPLKTRPPDRFDILREYLVQKEFVHFEGAFGWREENLMSCPVLAFDQEPVAKPKMTSLRLSN